MFRILEGVLFYSRANNRSLCRGARMFYVYFIQAGKGAIKIGRAKNVDRRLKELQVGNPQELTVLATIPHETEKGAKDMEQHLHDTLKSKRIRGEWFQSDIKLNELNQRLF